ncbi:SRPBCC domain-containing protein [Sinomonas sp. P10A9]|uniref:SRPBCC domain-containing protein n=1 Tax=Sinomonas puerhi TaxID=3238584 RepID=A0AB39L6X8_9MICC
MDPLFSHASQTDGDKPAQGDAPPSRVYRLALPVPRDIVYNAFVGDLHLWWPAAYTGFGAGTHAFLEEGIVGEEGPDGTLQVWGEVAREDPGELLELVWKLAWRPDAPTRLEIVFEDCDGGTVVTLTHDGWAAGSEGRKQFEKYADWPEILGRFAAFFGEPAESVETV